jgi:hypothetical protein
MNAFEKGWYDAERGRLFKHNPYSYGTPDWLLWRNGWREFIAIYLS